MKTKSILHLLLLAAGTCVAPGVLGGCSAGEADDASSEDAVTGTDERFGPTLFRNDFASYLKRDGYSEEDIQKLVFLPTKEVMKPAPSLASNISADKRLQAYDQAFTRIKPSDLYEHGRETPIETHADLEQTLRRTPVHIVILPGIFSEFIPLTPFEELFSKDSSAKRSFADRGARVKDDRYNVRSLATEQRPLTELVRVGSIDAADGTPLVTAAYMKAGVGSLEDFGSEKDNATIYLRRLDRYFEALGGVPENLYIMGYSRGTVAGLEVMARAARENKPWASKIRGFISHAGVIYGSPLADAAVTGGPSTDMLNLLKEFVGSEGNEGILESCEGGATDSASLGLRTSNYGHWLAFSARFARIALTAPNHNAELRAEGIDTNLPDGGRFMSFAARVLGIPLPGTPSTGVDGVVDLSNAISDHCANVERFKTTARAIIVGAESLTTKARIDWWKDPAHTLPTGPRYFAITGTMGDAAADGRPWALSNNEVAYQPGSVDHRSLRNNYYDMLGASGHQLQDSQVPVQRGRFWPDLHASGAAGAAPFNPNQEKIKTYFMGTVGVHHWGLAFPRAFTTAGVRESNPFPRTTLLEAMATFVAQVQREDR